MNYLTNADLIETVSACDSLTATRFVWDGWDLLAEVLRPASGVPSTNYYIWVLDLSQTLQGTSGSLLAVSKGGVGVPPATYFPVCDGNGNITDYLSNDGITVAHREYDPFGRTVAATGAKQADFNLWFSSKQEESQWGLYYYGYRFYSPELGRWISRDPMGEESFLRRLKEGRTRQEKRRLRNRSQQPAYLFVANCSICSYDILGLDDPGCNLPDVINPGRGNRGNADCYRRCCAQHDACYFRNGCTASSWGLNIGGIATDIAGCKFCYILVEIVSPCARCNSSVIACFARCCTGINPPTGDRWFCPNGPNRGRYYNRWKDIPADCWENGQKPENP